MVFVTLVSVMSIAAQAASVSVGKLNFGYMVPTNAKGTKVLSTVKLYGTYDYIDFYVNSEKDSSYFFYEIYSDKKYTKVVDSGYFQCDEGEYTFTPKIKLKGTYKTKTYYAVTYAAKIYSNENAKIDQNSMCEFKISVDRTTAFNKRMVMLKSVKTTVDGPKITWNACSGASKYYIYRRSISGTKWTKVGTVSSSKRTFTDKKAKAKDGNYIYTVKAVNKKGTASRYHYMGLQCLYAEAPVISSVSVAANNIVQVKWNKTTSKAKYDIYRKENKGGWKKIKSNYTSTTYKDTTAKNGKKYTYTIRAVISSNYGKATSAYYANADKVVTHLTAPALNEITVVETGLNITWSLVDGAIAYTVYRKPLDGSTSWKVLKKVGANVTSYIDTTASITDGAYVYTVRSEGKTYRGSYESGKEYFVLSQPEFDVSVDTNGIHMSWAKIPYATSYRILEQKEDGTWKIKSKTKKTTYDFEPSTYYVKNLSVCAVRSDVESPYKTDVEETVCFPEIKPYVNELTAYSEIIWNTTPANKYRVYRKLKDAPDTEYELCYEGQDNRFKNTDCENDVAYTYQVRGIYNDIEQYLNLTSVSSTRYETEKYIKDFYIRKDITESSLYKGKIVKYVDYVFVKEKTQAAKDLSEIVYYKSEGDWYQVCKKNDHILGNDLDFADNPITFSYAVYDENGTTPLDGFIGEIITENCEAPEITITPTKKGYKISWKAVENAVGYDVVVDFSKKTDYKKTIEADGSKTYSVSLTDVQYNSDTVVFVTAVHKNGNKACRRISNYRILKAPELVKAGVASDTIKVVWNAPNYGYNFAVFRKAEGESEWTVVSKKYYDTISYVTIDGKEYRGFVYTDKKAKKGVKYTYTVRYYDPETKEYVSYYNTKGVSAKR